MKKLFFSDHSVSISPLSMIVAICFILTLYFLYYIRGVLTLLFLAFILMVALHPLMKFFHYRWRFPKSVSMFFAYAIALLIVIALFAFLLPPLIKQLLQLITTLDIPFLQEKIKEFDFTVQEFSSLVNNFGGSVGVLLSAITSAFNSFFTIITIFIMSFYIMFERQHLYKKLTWFTSNQKKLEIFKDFIDSLEVQLGGWVRAQLFLMLAIFCITYLSLLTIGIPYALPLALLAGLLEIIPNLGPTIAMIPAAIIAYITFGPVMTIIIVVLYALIQQFENSYLVPKLMQTNANVNPLISITVMMMGLTISGFLGALLSIPTYVILRSVFGTFVRPQLED